VVIGDLAVFAHTARRLDQRLPLWRVVSPNAPWKALGREPLFIDLHHEHRFVPGRPSRAAGQASLDYLDRAVGLIRARRIHALVTAPVTKWSIDQAHEGFIGQTEYLANALGRRDVVMMFVSDRLRIVLLTRHLAIRKVPHTVTRRLVRTTLRLASQALKQWFHIARPRLALCGLNPHAGESGLFGEEERRVLLPVIRALQRTGMACEGPFASDGFFAQESAPACAAPSRSGFGAAGRYDAVICWYHDQGLIPFKMLARDQGCQLTIGLPIARTSPDHGSALDIAGRGIANPGSMIYALKLAIKLAQRA